MSLKASQIDFLLSGMTDASGNVLSAGTVNAYVAGSTNTTKAIWEDRDKATPAANPIVLDSKGTSLRFGDGLYKFLIKDSAGTTIDTRDNVAIGLDASQWTDVATYASLTAAVAAIGASTKTTLLIDSSTAVTAATTVTANIELVITKTGLITKTAGTLAINSSFDAGRYQVFSGFSAGDVTFGANALKGGVLVEWWGGAGDNSTENYTAAMSATASVSTYGGLVQFLDGIYCFGTEWNNSSKRVSIKGLGIDITTLKKTANVNLLTITNSSKYQTVGDFTIDSNSKTGWGLQYTAMYGLLRNLVIKNNAGVGSANAALYVSSAAANATVSRMENIRLTANAKSFYASTWYAFSITNFNVDSTSGLFDDVNFVLCSQGTIDQFTLSDDMGLMIEYSNNISINGIYLESYLNCPAITVGTIASISQGISLRDIHARKTSTNTSDSPFISIAGAGTNKQNILIEGYNYVGGTGTHTSGHIVTTGADVLGFTLKNVRASGTSATQSAAKILDVAAGYSINEGTIESISIPTGAGDSPTISGKFVNSTLKNIIGVPVVLLDNSALVTLENVTGDITVPNVAGTSNISLIHCSGTITDAGKRATRVNDGFISSVKAITTAAELTLGQGNLFYVTATGVTAVTSILAADSIAGRIIRLIFTGAATIAQANNLYTVGGGTLTFAANDMADLACYNATNWFVAKL